MIQVDTTKVYSKVFGVRESDFGKAGVFSPEAQFTLNCKVPDTLSGKDLMDYVLSPIIITSANKLRKGGYEKFKNAPKVIEVTLATKGTRQAAAPQEPIEWATGKSKEEIEEQIKLLQGASEVLAMKTSTQNLPTLKNK